MWIVKIILRRSKSFIHVIDTLYFKDWVKIEQNLQQWIQTTEINVCYDIIYYIIKHLRDVLNTYLQPTAVYK